MTNTLLVTGIYAFEPGHPYYLHGGNSRFWRYVYSLIQISKCGLDIKCYTSSSLSPILIDKFSEYNITNIEVIVKELNDTKHNKRALEIREKHLDKFKCYYELGQFKMYFIKENYLPEYDYIYWIDAGLSHRGLYPDKYNTFISLADGFAECEYQYTYDKIYNEELFNKINKWVGDKLLDIRNTSQYHSNKIMNEVFGNHHFYKSNAIGGLFGGYKDKIEHLIREFEVNSEKCLTKEHLLDHEAILTPIAINNPEWFKTFTFDTWYHEDTDQDWVTDEFFDDNVSFYKFFETINK